jgi:hypothetical protein
MKRGLIEGIIAHEQRLSTPTNPLAARRSSHVELPLAALVDLPRDYRSVNRLLSAFDISVNTVVADTFSYRTFRLAARCTSTGELFMIVHFLAILSLWVLTPVATATKAAVPAIPFSDARPALQTPIRIGSSHHLFPARPSPALTPGNSFHIPSYPSHSKTLFKTHRS